MDEARITNIPANSILGLNYSGAHDSAIAIVSPSGRIHYACSLERISRVKQDGRPPVLLLENLPWKRIRVAAVSTQQEVSRPSDPLSRAHPVPLVPRRDGDLRHGPRFQEFLETIPVPKEFVCHYLSHAASAFWLSGFDESMCLVYDGGIFNSPWFGGVYKASRKAGIEPVDMFCSSHYAKIATLYSIVTAVLGFTPNKHEGKVTGLAAFGSVNKECRRVLEELFTRDYYLTEQVAEWFFLYSDSIPPNLSVNEEKRKSLEERFQGFSREDVAATLQAMAEDHVVEILENARRENWVSDTICLAGGLFANVRINKRVKEWGFNHVFVAPPMTDDGTALGAALVAASRSREFSPSRMNNMFLGPGFTEDDVVGALNKYSIRFTKKRGSVEFLANRIAEGATVGVFQGAMEFGPRALGNRSILCQGTDRGITQILNSKLHRTEFMPFAPITRAEDVEELYFGVAGAEAAAQYMTIAFDCKEKMKEQTPGVVHVDGTARPQIVSKELHPFLHELLTQYKRITGIASIINTSFNIHEEPIVCTPSDAIAGFFEAGLDFLYFEGGIIIDFNENKEQALTFLRQKNPETKRRMMLEAVNAELWNRLEDLRTENEQKEKEIRKISDAAKKANDEIVRLTAEAEATLAQIQILTKQDLEKEEEIAYLTNEADARLSKMHEMIQALEEKEKEIQKLKTIAEERLAEMQEKDNLLKALRSDRSSKDRE